MAGPKALKSGGGPADKASVTGKEASHGKANRVGDPGESGGGESGLAVVVRDRGGALGMTNL